MEVVVDEPEDHDLGAPRPDVAEISEVGLVEPIRLDAEVEHLNVGAQLALEPVSPRVLVADV